MAQMGTGVPGHGAQAGSLYYQHSGKVDLSGTVVSLLAGVLIAAIAGTLYAAAVYYVPFIKLRWLACFGLGLCLGAIPAGLMQKLKVRNTRVVQGVVLLVTGVGFYAAWAAWEIFVLQGLTHQWLGTRLALHPMRVYHFAAFIYPRGIWTMGEHSETAVSGLTLGFVWLCEAGIIFWTALFSARSIYRKNIFCEDCRQWCDAPKVIRVAAPVESGPLKQQLEAGDYGFVQTLKPVQENEFISFIRQGCARCGQLNTLSVSHHRVVTDKKGRAKKSRTRIVVDKLLVTSADYEQLAPPSSAQEPAVAPADATAPA